MAQTKEPVRLRERKLTNGNISLYLDIYYRGKRDYEFLKLYLIPETTKAEKEQNRQTRQLANSIKALRIVEIQNGTYGFNSSFKLDTNFLDYFDTLAVARKKSESVGNYANWISTRKHLGKYCKPTTTFRDIDEKFCQGFKSYLEKTTMGNTSRPLSSSSQNSYFCKFKACIRQAYDEKIIPHDVCRNISAPRAVFPARAYLTLDEIKKLSQIGCKYPILRRAFLFSCLTGIRWSDIEKMRWSEVQNFNGGTRIVFQQKKTKGVEYLDINQQAADLMGERRNSDDKVFDGLKYSQWYNTALREWCLKAGISKDITFHCGRHTFAVMMLNLGADIYTVSKLLGHREIHTTQIYAKLLDKKKQEAVAMIPDGLIND